ncbi:signal peptide peptidase A. Serine peptidase. MEROPS family S49 [Rhizobium sp. RU35A]|uniref:Signal peptide peptidase SppA n=1 Tax=Rhizobium straminoryzae TaxID=1387186 RepID=A0A549SMY1_9HYPH|nr:MULTISPECIES: signal peptide peptidase SppA [Rhizobium]TRL30989.1 signal peptide peptidase SppA [Rhizobium straminoryzae]SIR12840.1 signal peptide peptidase A. Serine peptidase. MEROPS family S49 [Rhizobium sp. RU35A]
MDTQAIADRRQLRRKLTFWRVAAVLLVIAIGFSLYRYVAPDGAATPHVARIEISGMITDDDELIDRLDRIAKNSQVKALIVSISSPGGTTYGGERIFKALRAVAEKKPVVSDIRTLAASAGYMIASAGDTIVAGESSITGSIGVIFQYPQLQPLLEKLGVSLEEIKSAPLKAEPSPFHPASDEAKAVIRAMVMDSYDWFVDLVADRRKLSREEALKLADGRIYTGRQAVKLKLVDELGGLPQIRHYLAGRGVAENLPIVDWKRKDDRGLLSLASALHVARLMGLDVGAAQETLGATGVSKLFLDGLVSVWQVGGE